MLNSGTSPVTINPSQGFESLTAGANGRFTLTIGANNGNVPTYDPYVRLLNVSSSQVVSGGLTTGSLFTVLVITNNVNGASGNPSIVLQPVVNGGGGPEENVLANGSTLLLELTLSNTTAY